MPDSDITVSGLTLTPGVGHNLAKWSVVDAHTPGGLSYLQLDRVELWASSTNDREYAELVAEGIDNAPHMGLVEGQTRYYWIRARNKAGYYGDWYPSDITSGIIGTVGFSTATTALVNGIIVTSVSAGSLTVAIKTISGDDPSATNPVFCGFRDESGAYAVHEITAALQAVVPSGATLGVNANSTAFRIWYALFDIDGVNTEFAVSVRTLLSTGQIYGLTEFGVMEAPKPLADTSDTVGVWYYADSDEAQHPMRVIGFSDWDSGLTAPGTYDVNADRTVLFGHGIKLAGEEVQRAINYETSVATYTGDIPYDNTIPQSSEGSGLGMNIYVRPTSKANVLQSEYLVRGANANAASLLTTVALFQDSETSAIDAAWAKQAAVDEPVTIQGERRAIAETTGNTTFSLRVGGSTGGSSSFTRNGIGGSGKYGGAMVSIHKLTEFMA